MKWCRAGSPPTSPPDKQSGIGGWSDQQLCPHLATGHAPGAAAPPADGGSGGENSLQFLTPEDNLALVKPPGISNRSPATPLRR
ncbi:hypothetical protein M8494_11735 [Serratia ureilytica]